MSKKLIRTIDKAIGNVGKEIGANAKGSSRFAAGLSTEGYAGGYLQALRDVKLLLAGVTPNTRGYWESQ
jgi:hypothetical protein